jgi:hypothetical protein
VHTDFDHSNFNSPNNNDNSIHIDYDHSYLNSPRDNDDNSGVIAGRDAIDNSQTDSYNTDYDHSFNREWKTETIAKNEMDASVTGNEVNLGSGEDSGDHVGGGSNTLSNAGIAVSGGSFANFAGVLTANWNTGLQSGNAAGTALAANANINFNHN